MAAALLAPGCLAPGRLTRQHEPSGVSTVPPPVDPASPGYGTPLAFADYATWAREQIRRARAGAGPSAPPDEVIVDMRAPFEWVPDPGRCGTAPARGRRRGLLLIHGLSDSPFLMRDLGAHFRDRCVLVRAILLPGHGTVPGDLLHATYGEWIEATRYGIESFAGQVDDLYVAGFSTGGTLAVYHALGQHALRQPIAALLLFSPAIKVASRVVPLANWHKIYSWALPRGRWDDALFDEGDAAKYESFPKNAGDQVYLLTLDVADRLARGRLTTPVFIALSRDDSTVDSRATIEFFNAITPPGAPSRNVLVNYTRIPYALGDQRPLRDRPSVHADQGIVSYSHVALPVSPDNAHYGRHGTYPACLAYQGPNDAAPGARQSQLLARCRTGRVPGDGVRLGENSLRAEVEAASALERLDPPLVLRRLTFNPDFAGMLAAIDAFLAGLETAR